MIRLPIWGIALGMSMVAIFSCRSMTPPVTYYTLDPIVAPSAGTVEFSNQAIVVGLLPIGLPGMIDRTQMALRSRPHQLAFSSLHRWAAYPNQLIQQTMGENLQVLMPDMRVVSAPWPMGLKPDVAVSVKFFELIGTPDQHVSLSAIWTIAASKPSRSESFRITLTEPMIESGYDELAAAHSRVLAVFCRKMADSLKAFIQQGSGK